MMVAKLTNMVEETVDNFIIIKRQATCIEVTPPGRPALCTMGKAMEKQDNILNPGGLLQSVEPGYDSPKNKVPL